MPVNKLGLGTVQFGLPYGISNKGGQTTAAEVTIILRTAAELGVTTIDTASAYGNAEEVLGENDLQKFSIVSKYITPAPDASIEQQLRKTLHNLGVSRLQGYLAHRPAAILQDPSQWKILKELQQQSLVDKVGFSLNTTEELQELLNKKFVPELVQVPYNYFDNRFESLVKRLKDKGCEIHSRSAFLQGLFFRDADTLPSFFDAVKPVLKKLQHQTENLAGALLNFVTSRPFIDKVIIGVENAQQLEMNIRDLKQGIELEKNTIAVPEQILMPFNWPKQ